MKTIKRTTGKSDKADGFADFFREASPKEKERVFREAAERANEDQRATFEQSNLAIKSR